MFMIIINAGFFIATKMIFKKTGADVIGIVNSYTQPRAPQAQRKRMAKPPPVNFNR
jgi:hypothetical protein